MFYFRLARELGMTVGHLLASMSSLEVSEWMAFFRVENDERDKAERVAKAKAKLGSIRGDNR